MATNNQIFTIRFFGNDIAPESFSSKELGNLLIHFEDSIRAIIDSKFPEANVEDIRIPLVEIKHESDTLNFSLAGSPETVREAVTYFGEEIDRNAYVNLPDKAYTGFKYLHNQVEAKQCSVELKLNDRRLCEIQYSHKLVKPENVFIKSDTTIYGELRKIGGDKPKAWIQLSSGEKLDFFIDIDKAEQLSPKLYKTVALKGQAKWNIQTKEIARFKLYDLVEYKPFHITQAFSKLRELSSGFWDKFNTNEEITKVLRSD